jgi:hypothetical protein
MTATLHVGAPAIVQEAGDWGRTNETLPVPPVCAKVISSREIEPAAPATVAMQVDVTPTVLGVQETETEVTPCVTARVAVPELAALLESPGYDAWIVTEPGVVPRTDTKQLVPETVHVAGSATAPAPVAEKAIFSPEIVPEAPDTVAVHCAIAFTAMEGVEQDTEVVVPVPDPRTGAAKTSTANMVIKKSSAIRRALLKKVFSRLLTKSGLV